MSQGPASVRQLGRYDLVVQIGEGGMAEVHLARQRGPRSFEKLVVVKTVRRSLASRPELATMLLEEARIAALLKHPNVVDIYDLGEEQGTFFIAMEYLEGESLAAVLKISRHGKRLDPFSTARIVADCAAGLHAAHELHSISGEALELVHQDVTPGNVIVLYSGQVKLVDFGVAKVRTTTDDGLVKGKTGYLAPELLDGAIADRRSDIWSLGVVLWEALTLRRLFYGKTEDEAIAKIRAGDVPPPSALVPSVPRELDEIVFRALARDPTKRYPTAHAMQEDLLQLLRHASWSGGTEPIARFMREVFVERIAARKSLLREMATGRLVRATTVERIQAIHDDQPSPPSGVVVGAHGSGARRLPARASQALPLRAPSEDEIVVQLADIDADDVAAPGADPGLAADAMIAAEGPSSVRRDGATPVATVRMGKLRRQVTGIAIGIGALVGAIGAVLALQLRGGAAEAPPDAGAVAQVVPVVAVDAAVEEVVVDAAVEPAVVVADTEPPRANDREPDRDRDRDRDKDRDRRDRDRERDRDRDKARDNDRDKDDGDTAAVAPPTSATAKSLYKEGLQKFVGGDTAGALKLFDQARAKDPRYAPVYRGLGMAYERRGDRSRARRAFETYLRLAPKASDAASIRDRLDRLK